MVSSDIIDKSLKRIASMTSRIYSFELKNDCSELETLRQHVKNFGQFAGLAEDYIFEINLCLDELFSNIVSYGFADDRQHLVQFTLQMAEDGLIIDVEDGGLPFNPLDKREPRIPIDPRKIKIGGLGIHIVKKLTDEMCYQRNHCKNHLTLKKSIESDKSQLSI